MHDMAEYGSGTVFWRPDRKRWIGMFEVHDGSQRRKRRTVSARTEAECWRKLREIRRISATLPAYDERMRLDRFMAMWLEDHVLGSVRPRTADNYRSQVEHHINPALGGHKLAGLRAPHVLRWRNDMLARGDHARSVSHRMACLRAALSWAVQLEMIERNVASLVPGPSVSQGDAKPLTVEQGRAFLTAVKGDPWEAIYVLALTLGMRQAEILGLRWEDVNLGEALQAHTTQGVGRVNGHADLYRWLDADQDRPSIERSRDRDGAGGPAPQGSAGVVQGFGTAGAGDAADRMAGRSATLTIRKALVWLRGKPTLEDPKTERSRRTLSLPVRAVSALRNRQKAQRLQRLASGKWSPHFDAGYDFVFADSDGYPIERTQITRAFQRHLAAAGLPRVSFHSCRHTAVDWMTELGMTMREVADVVGHSRPSLTADVYSSLGNAATVKVARLFDEALA
jgi:integrase